MTYKEIHKALLDREITWKIAAEAIGCSNVHLMNVCARRAYSARIARSVSVLIDGELSVIFADVPRYMEDKKAEKQKLVLGAKAKLEAAGIGAAA